MSIIHEAETKTTKPGTVSLFSEKTEEENEGTKLIRFALQNGANMEVIERLMALKEKWDAVNAKRAFDDAMAKFQGECPVIKKSKAGGRTKMGQVAFKYAPFEAIFSEVQPLLLKHGFSFSFREEDKEGKTRVVCVATHKLGHSEKSGRNGQLGRKTDIMGDDQHYAASLSYAKRYAFCNIFGIVVGGEDNERVLNNKTRSVTPEAPKNEERGIVSEYDEIKTTLKKMGAKNLADVRALILKYARVRVDTIEALTPSEGRGILAALLAAKGAKTI